MAESAGLYFKITAVEEEQSRCDESFLDFDPRLKISSKPRDRLILIHTNDRLLIGRRTRSGFKKVAGAHSLVKAFAAKERLFETGIIHGEGFGIVEFRMPVENNISVGVSQRKIEIQFSFFKEEYHV